MDNEYGESFVSRHRRRLGLIGFVAAVALTVLLYNLTLPKPTTSADGDTAGEVAEGMTIAVGALPVT